MNKKILAVDLINAAKEQFQKNGYEKTQVDDILRATKFTKNEFSEIFNSKEDCCLKILKSYERDQKDNFRKFEESVNARQRLSLYLDTFFDNAQEIARNGDPVLNLYYDLRNENNELSKMVVNILINQQNWIDEQFVIMMKTESARTIGDRLLAAINGLLLLVKLKNDPEMFKAQLIQLKSWIRSM